MTKYKDDPGGPGAGRAARARRARPRPEAVAEAMQGERVRWRNAGDRHLIVLGTLGNNVPFVGLFGTVLGVINAFENLRQKTAAAEDRTLDLIAEALAATAFGLLVAIPAVIAFNYFTRSMRDAARRRGRDARTPCCAMVHGAEHGTTPKEPAHGGK